MSEQNVNWSKIHSLVIYDPNMMRPSKEIDNAIYSIGGREFYTPILKFCEDIGDDNVYMECYVERATVEPRSSITMSRAIATTEYRVRVSFPKDKFSELLVRSIGADKYIWEDEAFQKIILEVFSDLAAHLTAKTKYPFISSFQRYILSSGNGTIITRDGELAGCFSGLIIESKPESFIETASGKRTTQPSLRVTVPNWTFNEMHYRYDQCIFTYTDSANGIKIVSPMSSFVRNGSGAPLTNGLTNMIFESTNKAMVIPNEDYSLLMNKKLALPQTKFEQRLLAIAKHQPVKQIEKVSLVTQEIRNRFKGLVKE